MNAWLRAMDGTARLTTETTETLPVPGSFPSNSGLPERVVPEIVLHLPLVWRVARQVARRLPAPMGPADLIGAGTLGLLRALARFEPARGENFAAYAEIRIRGAILDQLREQDWLPRSVRSKRRRLEAVTGELQQSLGRAPDADELACALGTSRAAVERVRRDAGADTVPVGPADDDGDRASVESGGDPGRALEERQRRVRLGRALDGLPARQQEVIALYFVEQRRLREIGALLGVSESRVSQILRETLDTLRSALADA